VRSFHPGFIDSPEPDTLPHGATPDAKNCLFGGIQLRGAFMSASRRARRARDAREAHRRRLLTPAQVVAGKGFDGLFEFRKVGADVGPPRRGHRRQGLVLGQRQRVRADRRDGAVRLGHEGPVLRVQRNLLFIMDGTTTRCWDGILANDLFTPGRSRRPARRRSP
jgi:hypothetical protein